MADIKRLIERLEKATGPDRELDCDIRDGVGFSPLGAPPPYTASLDAALALVERVLPGHKAGFQPGTCGLYFAAIYRVDEISVRMVNPNPIPASTPAIAMMIALLRALETEQGETE